MTTLDGCLNDRLYLSNFSSLYFRICDEKVVILQREKNAAVRDIRHSATGDFLAGGVSFALCLYGWLDTPARRAGQCRLLVVRETHQWFPY